MPVLAFKECAGFHQTSAPLLPVVRVMGKGRAMSDNYIEDDLDASDVEDSQSQPDIKDLRRAANSKKKLEQELADIRRELAFAKAGINPEDPKMKYFVRGYDGEMSAESVRAAALEAGFLASQEANPPADQSAAAQARVMQASAGSIIEDNTEQAALARLEAAMEEGGMDAMLDVARQYGIPISTEM